MDYRYTFVSADAATKRAVMEYKTAGKTGLLMTIFNFNQPKRETFNVIQLDRIFQEATHEMRAHPVNSLTARMNIREIQKAYRAMELPDFLLRTTNIPSDRPSAKPN